MLLAELGSYQVSLLTAPHCKPRVERRATVTYSRSFSSFVRDRKILSDALDVTPAYLRSKEGDSGTGEPMFLWDSSRKLTFALQ